MTREERNKRDQIEQEGRQIASLCAALGSLSAEKLGAVITEIRERDIKLATYRMDLEHMEDQGIGYVHKIRNAGL